MAPTLYILPPSPPVRSVLFCAKAIGLDLKLKEVKVFEKEHLSPEYRKINPEHRVPTLDDDGFILADSHAIMAYLVSKYGKDDSLYPKDLKKRAIVDQRLHFDNGVLFAAGLLIFRALLLDGETSINPKHLALLEDAFDITEQLLEKTPYIAGDHLTIADFSFFNTITGWSFVTVTEDKYPKMVAWMKKIEELPYYKETNEDGLNQLMEIIKNIMPK